jgi:uncharacterized membrane protein
MSVAVDMNLIITYTLAVFVSLHSVKFRGAYKTLLLFFAAIIIGGGMENINSIFGGYYYPGDASDLIIFIGMCPFDIILGWYVIIYCCSYVSHILIGKGEGSLPIQGIGTNPEKIDKVFLKRTVLRAALAGLIAVNLDLVIDPIAVENGWWVWTVPNLYIFDVPISNFFGWFFLIFWALVFYDTIVAYCSIKKVSQLKNSIYWCVGTIAAATCATSMLGPLTSFFSLDGIRTASSSIYPIDLTFTPERIGKVMIAFIMVGSALLGIMLSSLIPYKEPRFGPKTKIWRILPPLFNIIFWAMIMLVAILSGLYFVIIGITFGIPYLLINVFLIIKPYRD